MDFWNKAKNFAEEAAKKSQEFTKEAANKTQKLTASLAPPSRFPDIISETAKRSKELAAEASIQIKAEALKRADQIKSLNLLDNSGIVGVVSSDKFGGDNTVSADELDRFGVTEELRDFVQSINLITFRDFPLPDDAEVSDVPTVSNVQQDLTQWQSRHATLMLSTVKEISKLRYDLCPRIMKERKFWRIYFLLVNSHVAPYEKRYMEQAELKAVEQAKELAKGVVVSKQDGVEPAKPPLQKASSSAEQDLDVFLLGDLGDSDDGADDEDDGFDDDFDKIGEITDDEGIKESKR